MLNPPVVSLNNTSDGGVSSDGGVPPFSPEFFPDYDAWKHRPIQMKYATLKEYSDGTYSVLDWLEMHIMISHDDRYGAPKGIF